MTTSINLTDEEIVKQGVNFYAKYEPGEILGDGISSVVRRCVSKETQEEYAVKIIDKYSQKGQDIKGIDIVTQTYTEVKVLSKLKGHPGIIELVDFYDSSAFMFLVFELAKGGELFDYLTREVTIAEKTARIMMWQLFHSVFHMHKHGFVHRDLKPENILLDENNNILLSDFGFAKEIMEDEQLYDILGTPAYFAPETLKCVVYDSTVGYGKPVDMWACGVILYTLLAGQGPFWHRKDTIMYRKIMEGKYSFDNPKWEDISDLPQDLIRKLLIVDIDKRMTADEAMKHPWFKGLSACDGCRKLQGFGPKKRRKIKFKILVLTILSLKRLYYTFHERYVPMTYKAVLSEPYTFKDMRKMIDSCAFTMYGHWVKKTQDQLQNRGALFENTVKQEVIRMDSTDGRKQIPNIYSYNLTHAFLPKRPSFVRRSLNSPVNHSV